MHRVGKGRGEPRDEDENVGTLVESAVGPWENPITCIVKQFVDLFPTEQLEKMLAFHTGTGPSVSPQPQMRGA